MDVHQNGLQNPYGMDEDCRNCPGLCDERERVIHGYGDVGADFLFVGEAPSEGAEQTGVPFTGDQAGERLQYLLGSVGLNYSLPDATEPELDNAYLAYLTRCRHPEREPTDEEVTTCEPYLNADVRMINPEILVPVGQRALTELAREFTTNPAERFDIEECHATAIRGRGFELAPMIHSADQTESDTETYIDFFLDLKENDYRQTKGRRNR